MRRLLITAAIAFLLSACATTTNTDTATDVALHPATDIAGIMMAANEGEVQQGNAASTRATRPEVRAFAQMMVTDHTNAINSARDVFSRYNITPGDNDITSALRTNSQRTVTNLATYQGVAYDRTYMQTQVALHSWLLDALDMALIPSARNNDVRTLLQTQRGHVAMHLERAQEILRGL